MSLLTPLRRRRAGYMPRKRTRTLNTTPTDISTLPDPIRTPNERAWAVIEELETNPGMWKQDTYGEFQADGSTVGCFAHHVVRGAGYTEFGCSARHIFKRHAEGDCINADAVHTENGWEMVYTVSDRLLGLDSEDRTYAGLYQADRSISGLRGTLPLLVGPRPGSRRY